MNTVQVVNTTIGFSENLFLVIFVSMLSKMFNNRYICVCVCVCVCVCACMRVCVCMVTQKEIDLGTRNWNTL